jgi:hypothetical protein
MKQSGNIGANYHFLFLKDFIAKIKDHHKELHQFLTTNLS